MATSGTQDPVATASMIPANATMMAIAQPVGYRF
jgi:hypothetical protein